MSRGNGGASTEQCVLMARRLNFRRVKGRVRGAGRSRNVIFLSPQVRKGEISRQRLGVREVDIQEGCLIARQWTGVHVLKAQVQRQLGRDFPVIAHVARVDCRL